MKINYTTNEHNEINHLSIQAGDFKIEIEDYGDNDTELKLSDNSKLEKLPKGIKVIGYKLFKLRKVKNE